ncbi:MAG: hypothetical protein ACSHWY_01230 [Octadecabacter sp.]
MASKDTPLPPVADGTAKAPPTGRYKQQFAVLVICDDEATQAAEYAKLKAMGYKLKVVTT